MVRDSYCGIRTCDLPVSVLIQGTPRSAVGWGTSEFPGQLIAILLVAQWLERWFANIAAQVQSLQSRYSLLRKIVLVYIPHQNCAIHLHLQIC